MKLLSKQKVKKNKIAAKPKARKANYPSLDAALSEVNYAFESLEFFFEEFDITFVGVDTSLEGLYRLSSGELKALSRVMDSHQKNGSSVFSKKVMRELDRARSNLVLASELK